MFSVCQARGGFLSILVLRFLRATGVLLLSSVFLCETVVAATPATPAGAVRESRLGHYISRVMRDPQLRKEMVTVILEGDLDSTSLGRISADGGQIPYRFGKRSELRIPASRLEALLARLPDSIHARLPYPHQAVAVTSEGVGISGATDMQALGSNGAGVKVGIIDLGFAGYGTSQAAGELPPTGSGLTITDYTGTGTGGTNHGTNVAEIVHDMAPGAELYLAKIATDTQLEQAKADMVAAGVRVINHSVAWFGAAYYDGSGPICSTADSAEASGVQWVNAMGNSRAKHYAGTFSDTNGNSLHEFASGEEYNIISLTAGTPLTLILNWDNYATYDVDYNLYLYDGNPAAGGSLVASSASTQTGRRNSASPYEAIDFTPSTTGDYYIVVSKDSSTTANLPLTLFSLGPALGTQTFAGSIVQPADCNSVLSVAATNLTDGLEWFSSEGPTTDGRDKPEISAPNRTQTSLSSSFAGTSGASPHAAGAVALLLSQYPALTPIQLRNALIATAVDLHTSGYDFRTGFGRISLDADGDGINHDTDNCLLDSNPTQTDTDSDGQGDVCDDDDDNDGLPDADEIVLGTNPLLADTDGDGLTDGDEVTVHGTSPLLADSDGDSLTDSEEINLYSTNPLLADSDGDTLDDGNEVVVYGSDPLKVDTDGDGYNDNIEVAAGSDPTSSGSIPGQASGDLNGDGAVDVRDLLLGYRVLAGTALLTQDQLLRGDVAPLSSGAPSPDGLFNLGDLLVIQRKAIGAISF